MNNNYFEQYSKTHTFYKWYEIIDFCRSDFWKNVKKNGGFLNVPVAFDIETTNVDVTALCYIWQCDIDGYIFIGRTLQEFKFFLLDIKTYLKLQDRKKLIIYVHNLEYEFQFIKHLFEWENVFALSKYKPIKATAKDYYITFKCSYKLSNLSLAHLSEETHTKKLVGDLDYNVTRNSKTPLTKKEIQYCINDVEVVVEYIRKMISQYGNISKIPLTSTGKVRVEAKKQTLKSEKYKKMIKYLTIEPVEFLLLKRAFQGGYTHANACHVEKNLFNVKSFDLTSSYPAVMCRCKFPMSKGKKVVVKSRKHFEYLCEKNCCIFECKFVNLRSCVQFENYLSFSKCYNVQNYVVNNGRLVKAQELTTVLTELDFNIVKKVYKWDKMLIGVCYVYKKDYLPVELINCVLEWYNKKTTLKGVKGKENLYALSKTYVNSLFGMIVTGIDKPIISFSNTEWCEEPQRLSDVVYKYNNSNTRFLFYPWGIYVTANARSVLWDAILELKDDYIYSDTDSVKFFNYEKHKKYFDETNKKIINSLKKMCEAKKIPTDKISPKNINGKVCPMGVWDFDGDYKVFKTLGAKRYIYIDEKNNPHLTIAGVPKKGKNYIVSKFGKYGMFNAFNNFLSIPPEETGKLTHSYIDEEFTVNIIDGFRNSETVKIPSSIVLSPAPFKLTLAFDFIKYLKNIRTEERGY